MNTLKIIRGNGGLGRKPLGSDYISGLLFYPTSTTLGLTGCPIANGTKLKLGGVQDAINAGINGNHFGETAAIVEYVVTHIGATGDIIQVKYVDCQGNITILCNYTQISTDTTDSILAASLTAAINANSGVSGFTAVNTGGPSADISITVKSGEGIFPNTGTPLKAAVTNNTGTLFTYTQSVTTDGVGSQLDVFYYHISRYFTQNPSSTVFVEFIQAPTSFTGYTFPDVTTLFNYSSQSIRQMGVYVDNNNAEAPTMAHLTANVKAIQAQVTANITAYKYGFSVAYAPTLINATGSVLSAALTDLSTANSEHVSVIIGQDGAAIGNHLYNAYGISVSNVGDVLGLMAQAQVSDDISWVQNYILSINGVENAVPGLSTGEMLSNLSAGIITGLDIYRYLFGFTYPDNSPSGTFLNDSHCATAYTSDYSYISDNRTFDKAARIVVAAYVPVLASPLQVNADGTLTNPTVAYFEGIGETELGAMTSNNPNTNRPELSGVSITIDPTQDVSSNETFDVIIELLPIGSSKNIVINLSFTANLT